MKRGRWLDVANLKRRAICLMTLELKQARYAAKKALADFLTGLPGEVLDWGVANACR